ncbi:hypothetical protein [Gemmatimonas sp.]|uniref:hypothetical protein n=1 Tax=Gemmatimonas sp. TaxID=1962908 RepID=UPI003DA256EE
MCPETVERRPSESTARREPVALEQSRGEIHERIADGLQTVGLQLHTLKGIGLVEIALRVDDMARRVPVAAGKRHRATDRRVGHEARTTAGIDHQRNTPQSGPGGRNDGDFDVGGATCGVGRIRQQRFGLWPPQVAQSAHECVTPGFERAPVEKPANAHGEIARRRLEILVALHAPNGEG